MDCWHRTGFTYRPSRLKYRTSEKMGGLITNNEELFFLFTYTFIGKQNILGRVHFFFAVHYTDIFIENRASENVKTLFSSSNQCDQIALGLLLSKSIPQERI